MQLAIKCLLNFRTSTHKGILTNNHSIKNAITVIVET